MRWFQRSGSAPIRSSFPTHLNWCSSSPEARLTYSGVSARHLQTLFAGHFGTSPYAHYQALRLNRARRLLVRWEKKADNYLAFVHLQFAYIALKQAGVLG